VSRTQSPGDLDVQIATYLKSIAELRSHKTWLAYSRSLNSFFKSCQCATLAEITEGVLKKFVKDMKKEGLSDPTIANRIAHVVCFLREHDSDASITHRYSIRTGSAGMAHLHLGMLLKKRQ
jgi:site-specific recombinase XerC